MDDYVHGAPRHRFCKTGVLSWDDAMSSDRPPPQHETKGREMQSLRMVYDERIAQNEINQLASVWNMSKVESVN